MGIKKLFTFLNNNKLYKIYPYLINLVSELNLNKKEILIGIDGNLFCYKYSHSYDNMLIGFFNQILNFLSNGLIPLYIFDGGTINEKENTNLLRNYRKYISKLKLNLVEDKINDGIDNIDLFNTKKKLEKNSIKISMIEISLLLELLDMLNIPYIFSHGEGEYLAVLLNKYNIIDILLSDDTDPIPGGINKIIKYYNNNVYYLDTKLIYSEFDITYTQFCDFCILLGSDYANFNHGLKYDEVLELIKKHKTIEDIVKSQENINIDISNIDNIRNIYYNSYNNEKLLFIDPDNALKDNYYKIIDHNNYNYYSNIMLEFWDQFIDILKKNENDDIDAINSSSTIFKQNINNYIRTKKFNIKNITKFLKNNIKDISKLEINNTIISFEYLNTFGI